MRKQNRPAIPSGMRREIRKRDGYGCVVCGIPIYEYEHFIPYATVQRHERDNIYLICRQHHVEKQSGLLPKERIIGCRYLPYNKVNRATTPYALNYSGTNCNIVIGDNVFKNMLAPGNEFTALTVDDEDLIKFSYEDGRLFLNLKIYKSPGVIALDIQDNELIINTDNWDIEFIAKRLIIRRELRKIVVEIIFSPPSDIKIYRGLFFSKLSTTIKVSNDNVEMFGDWGRFSQNRSRYSCMKRCIAINSNVDTAGIGILLN